MSKFKVGDRVRVVRDAVAGKVVGTRGEVTAANPNIAHFTTDDGAFWSYPPSWLEPADPQTAEPRHVCDCLKEWQVVIGQTQFTCLHCGRDWWRETAVGSWSRGRGAVQANHGAREQKSLGEMLHDCRAAHVHLAPWGEAADVYKRSSEKAARDFIEAYGKTLTFTAYSEPEELARLRKELEEARNRWERERGRADDWERKAERERCKMTVIPCDHEATISKLKADAEQRAETFARLESELGAERRERAFTQGLLKDTLLELEKLKRGRR